MRRKSGAVGRWFERIITWLIPVEFVALITWWMWQSATSSGGEWWNPFGEFTVGTVVFQVGLLILFCLGINRFVWKRTSAADPRPNLTPTSPAR